MPSSSDLLKRVFAKPALVLPLALASAAAAVELPGWGEPHLAVISRTAPEAERVASATAPPTEFGSPQRFEDLPAGAATVRGRPGTDAFSQSSGNMDFAREMDFKLGNALFTRE